MSVWSLEASGNLAGLDRMYVGGGSCMRLLEGSEVQSCVVGVFRRGLLPAILKRIPLLLGTGESLHPWGFEELSVHRDMRALDRDVVHVVLAGTHQSLWKALRALKRFGLHPDSATCTCSQFGVP